MILKDLRENKRLTQREVSKLTGIPYNTYRRYEYGKREPSFRAVVALAKLYGMSPGELLDKLVGWKTP